jgi:hypothetical protein
MLQTTKVVQHQLQFNPSLFSAALVWGRCCRMMGNDKCYSSTSTAQQAAPAAEQQQHLTGMFPCYW